MASLHVDLKSNLSKKEFFSKEVRILLEQYNLYKLLNSSSQGIFKLNKLLEAKSSLKFEKAFRTPDGQAFLKQCQQLEAKGATLLKKDKKTDALIVTLFILAGIVSLSLFSWIGLALSIIGTIACLSISINSFKKESKKLKSEMAAVTIPDVLKELVSQENVSSYDLEPVQTGTLSSFFEQKRADSDSYYSDQSDEFELERSSSLSSI